MDKNEISINQIALRSQGLPPKIARGAVDGLGQELITNLAQRGLVQPGQRIQLGDLNLGTISLPRGGEAKELRREIVRVLTNEIVARLRRK